MESTVQRSGLPAPRHSQLRISIDDSVAPPSSDYSLLLGFHFGAWHPHAELPGVVSLDLASIGRARSFESWWCRGDVRVIRQDAVSIAECDDYAAVTLTVSESDGDDFQNLTRRAYETLVAAVHRTSHPQIIKIWNYIGGINSGEGDLERYRQFSVGRAAAFDALGVRDEDLPAGTAIGTLCDTGLQLIALSSRRNFGMTENPRQVSAFRYPRQYGPSSPRFSRVGFVSTGSERLFLISGTAAVVGHESAYPFDVLPQTEETLRNLDVLCDAVSRLDSGQERLVLDDRSVLRVYLRNPNDHERVSQKLRNAFGRNGPSLVFLHGLICRRELMVEIDGARVASS